MFRLPCHYGYLILIMRPHALACPYQPHTHCLPAIVAISVMLSLHGRHVPDQKLTLVTRESVADSILGLLEHALTFVASLLRVRLHAVGLHRSERAVHAARCLVLGLLRVRLAAVGLHGLGGFVGE